jgi:phosphate transport system substrate-binding protein
MIFIGRSTKMKRAAVACIALSVCLAAGCKNQPPQLGDGAGAQGGQTAVPVEASKEAITINGAGASFPFPIYSQWAATYHDLKGTKINYQSIGSGGGIAQIKAGTVDFGASDAPLEKAELDEGGLVQFPMVIGGVVPVFNIEGIETGKLKLTPEALAGIYLGRIKRWDDTSLEEENPDIDLPGTEITVVHRADGSGTTWIFTSYLAQVSAEWKKKVGSGKAVSWPAGVGGKGNEGVAANVQRIPGSIGYVEYAYALQNAIPSASLKNRAGTFVLPTIAAFQAAAASADWESAPGFYMVLTDQPGDQSWPVTGASFILVHGQQKDERTAKAMLAFFDWCFRHGAEDARKLDYVPLPESLVALVEKAWSDTITAEGRKVWP